MAEGEQIEGREGVARIEAFSDGVLAIIITIMVLELKAPEEPGLDHLWRLWPTFLAYALSYAYVAIYWVNHHRMFSHARQVTNGLVWANITLLFTLSLVHFTTAYLGSQHFGRDAAVLYLANLFAAGLAYFWLEHVIRCTGSQTARTQDYLRAMLRKGQIALATYLAGIALSFVVPWLGVACAAIVAAQWILPWGPFDRFLLRKRD